MCSPSCHSVSVKWQQLSRDAPEPLQAPARVPSLFHNDRLLVYGFIPHCTQVGRCTVPYTVRKTMNDAAPLLLHRLASCWHYGPPTPGTWPEKLLISLEMGGCYQKGCCSTVPLAGSRKVNKTLVFLPFQATLCALIQEKEFHTMVSTTELQKTTGTVSQILSTGLWVELSGRTPAKQAEGSLPLPIHT